MPFTQNLDSVYGPKAAIIRGELTLQDCRAICEAGIDHVVIGSTADVSNLVHIDGLTRLDVLAVDPVDLSPVSELTGLRWLSIGGNWRGHISLEQMKHLEVFGGDLKRPKAIVSEVASASALRAVEGSFPEEFLRAVVQCPRLTRLHAIRGRVTNLDWLIPATSLQALKLSGFSSLANLDGLSRVPDLRFLALQGCRKLGTLKALNILLRLECLLLDDCGRVESLEPIQSCAELRVLSFLGDTAIVDGRVSVLQEFRDRLAVRFIDRSHYDCKASRFHFDDASFADIYKRHLG